MGTKVSSIPDRAGVICPKQTGKMDKREPCSKCEHNSRCWDAIAGVLGASG